MTDGLNPDVPPREDQNPPIEGAFERLDAQEKKLVCVFLETFHQGKSMVAAGYSPNTSSTQMFGRPRIRAAIQDVLPQIGISPERIKNAIAEIAFAQDIADFDALGEGQTPAQLRAMGVPTHLISKIKFSKRVKFTGDVDPGGQPVRVPMEDVTIELQDRLKALELLGKTLALFMERTEHSFPKGEISLALNFGTSLALGEEEYKPQ